MYAERPILVYFDDLYAFTNLVCSPRRRWWVSGVIAVCVVAHFGALLYFVQAGSMLAYIVIIAFGMGMCSYLRSSYLH